MRITFISTAAMALGLAACGSPEADTANDDAMVVEDTGESQAMADMTEASAPLTTADGREVGIVTATQTADGVRMAINVSGMPEGPHGAHIHDVGTCSPDFMASGPHWAPFDAALGLGNESTADDSENAMVNVGADGNGTLEYTLGNDITLAAMMEGDGSSFMIHQRPDDPGMEAAPDNGDRIACGVFTAGA